MSIESILQAIVRQGDLTLRLPGGKALKLGDGSGPPLVAVVTDPIWAARIAANPGMAVGEAYMEGKLVLEQGQVGDFIDLIGANAKFRKRKNRGPLRRWLKARRREANARRQARSNVHHHYDLSLDLYRRFLDTDLQYSCAYFERPDMTLEEAQVAKKRHIAAKLLIEPGMSVLDIGCGWGGMGLTLAEECGARVHGVTLSTEQLATANERAAAKGLSDRAKFTLTDYRDLAEPVDRIVSVGMFEHVGRPNFQAYFDQVAQLLKDDGVALIHTIGRSEGPGVTSQWIDKYIFPGGYVPALSEMLPAIERAGLFVTDVEVLRLHYAETIKVWRERFAAQRAEIAQLYDERFCRMWEFYLGVSEMSFRHRRHVNFQVQLTKTVDALPITRDYLAEAESRMSDTERKIA